jgi:Asp-tRNAAsn/Glu-tRNAGln amidotransferase A subunit and related amidases
MTGDPHLLGSADAVSIARAVRQGSVSAQAVVAACLERIRRRDPQLNAFTAVLEDRPYSGGAVDRQVAQGSL